MIISAPIEEPITWRISKVENTSPLGINKITVAQDKYDQFKDYIEKDADGNVIAMWADYYESNIIPNQSYTNTESSSVCGEIKYQGIKPQIKIGGNYRIYTAIYQKSNDEIIVPDRCEWEVSVLNNEVAINNNPIDIIYPIQDDTLSSNQIKIRFIGCDDYLGDIMIIKNKYNDLTCELQVEIVGM